MKEIFAHRALINSEEHSIKGILKYIDLGLGIELDLRKSSHGIYLSHDPTNSGILFRDICPILLKSESTIALHIKELTASEDIKDIINEFSLEKIFVFDTDYEYVSKMFSTTDVAYYASKIPSNNINAKIFWCDELEKKWFTKENIDKMHMRNKTIYSVSRELVKQSTMEEIYEDWGRLIKVGFDGICTNYPLELQQFWRNLD
jgi:glycerophosphoryl diester phosphodiesterase